LRTKQLLPLPGDVCMARDATKIAEGFPESWIRRSNEKGAVFCLRRIR
jgi:hypothetical protein